MASRVNARLGQIRLPVRYCRVEACCFVFCQPEFHCVVLESCDVIIPLSFVLNLTSVLSENTVLVKLVVFPA